MPLDCKVAARIPSRFGEFRLHLYEFESVQHLALVFGTQIISKSLNEYRPNDSNEARAKRGAAALANCNPLVALDNTPLTNTQSGDALESSEGSSFHSTDTTFISHSLDDEDILNSNSGILVRIHSCCFTGEVVFSSRCDCGDQLEMAIQKMSKLESGVIIYLNQEGRGIGLMEKLFAYNLIDQGHDTVSANLSLGHPADAREYQVARLILEDLGIDTVRLMTNNPKKIQGLAEGGINVIERVPVLPSNLQKGGECEEYLRTKIEKMGHLIDMGNILNDTVGDILSSTKDPL